MRMFAIYNSTIYLIIIIGCAVFLLGLGFSALLRKLKYKYYNFYLKWEDLLISIIFLLLFIFPFIFQYLFKINIHITGIILFFTISSIGFSILFYFFILDIKELKYKINILKKEQILFNYIKQSIKNLPNKRLFNTDEVVKLLSLDRRTIKMYERELIRFTTLYSEFGDEIYAKEEVELFIICDFLLKTKKFDINKVKNIIINYAKKFKDLKYFKKMKYK